MATSYPHDGYPSPGKKKLNLICKAYEAPLKVPVEGDTKSTCNKFCLVFFFAVWVMNFGGLLLPCILEQACKGVGSGWLGAESSPVQGWMCPHSPHSEALHSLLGVCSTLSSMIGTLLKPRIPPLEVFRCLLRLSSTENTCLSLMPLGLAPHFY